MRISLDGYVEGPNGDMSWIRDDDKEAWDDLFAGLPNTDTLLLGGKMYPGYAGYWQSVLDGAAATEEEQRYARWAAQTNHIVFSSTLKKADWPHTRIIRNKTKEEVLKLKQEPGKNIVVLGGATLAASLIDLGLVDEYKLLVVPILLGGSIALFGNLQSRHSLRLMETKTLSSGNVILSYAAAG